VPRFNDRDRGAVGERIAEARRAAGLTQAALAEHLGVPLGVVDGFELGRSDPSKHIEKIAEVIGRSPDWLRTGSDAAGTGDSMLLVLGERVRDARQAAGLSESELAQRLGLAEGDVAGFESGKKDASTLLERIAQATGKPASWFGEKEEAMPEAETPAAAIVAPAVEVPARSEPEDELDRLFASLARQRDELKRRQVESDRRTAELDARTADLDEVDRQLRQMQEAFEQEWVERLREFEELQRRAIELATTLADRATGMRRELAPELEAPELAREVEQPG
jgi:transcriptional regulator with XRE-family HTH domain